MRAADANPITRMEDLSPTSFEVRLPSVASVCRERELRVLEQRAVEAGFLEPENPADGPRRKYA
jgi:hypothetical protein